MPARARRIGSGSSRSIFRIANRQQRRPVRRHRRLQTVGHLRTVRHPLRSECAAGRRALGFEFAIERLARHALDRCSIAHDRLAISSRASMSPRERRLPARRRGCRAGASRARAGPAGWHRPRVIEYIVHCEPFGLTIGFADGRDAEAVGDRRTSPRDSSQPTGSRTGTTNQSLPNVSANSVRSCAADR